MWTMCSVGKVSRVLATTALPLRAVESHVWMWREDSTNSPWNIDARVACHTCMSWMILLFIIRNTCLILIKIHLSTLVSVLITLLAYWVIGWFISSNVHSVFFLIHELMIWWLVIFLKFLKFSCLIILRDYIISH